MVKKETTTYLSKIEMPVTVSVTSRFYKELEYFCEENAINPSKEFLKTLNSILREAGYKSLTDFAIKKHDFRNTWKMLNIKLKQELGITNISEKIEKETIQRWKRNNHKFEYLQEDDLL